MSELSNYAFLLGSLVMLLITKVGIIIEMHNWLYLIIVPHISQVDLLEIDII